jgi:hypothetical protein
MRKVYKRQLLPYKRGPKLQQDFSEKEKRKRKFSKRLAMRRLILGLMIILTLISIQVQVKAAEVLGPVSSEGSQVTFEGFTALNDLKARLQWGGVVLEEEVKKGSSGVKFVAYASNIRSSLNISIEPDGLSMELIPTAMGYSPKKLSIGSNVRVEGALKVAIQETLTVMNLTTFVIPPKAVTRVLINEKDVPFVTETKKEATIVTLPSSLIVDIGRPVNVTIEGEDFIVNIMARKGLGEKTIDVTAEANGNVSEVSVRASSAKVGAVQEIYVPLQLLNVTNVLEDYGPLRVLFSKEEHAPVIEKEGKAISSTQLQQAPYAQTLLVLARYKWTILLMALVVLCTAVLASNKTLAVLALILFIAYFALAWLGGWL